MLVKIAKKNNNNIEYNDDKWSWSGKPVPVESFPQNLIQSKQTFFNKNKENEGIDDCSLNSQKVHRTVPMLNTQTFEMFSIEPSSLLIYGIYDEKKPPPPHSSWTINDNLLCPFYFGIISCLQIQNWMKA